MRTSTGVFHNRVTLNDSTLLGGNPPFQPMVVVSNGSVDNPSGGGSGAADLPFGMQGQDVEFKHPTSYMWSAGIQREIPFGFIVDATYVGRRGLYLQRERNINQLPLGVIAANPGVNIAALRPYKGYGVIRISENAAKSMYNSLQLSAERRYSNGLRLNVAYTLGKSEDNGSDKRNVLWNTYDDTIYWGPSNFDRRHVISISYIYDLPFWRNPTNLVQNLLGGWQISGATFMRTGTPFTITRTDDRANVGDGVDRPAGGPRRRSERRRERQVLDRHGRQLRLQSRGLRPGTGRRQPVREFPAEQPAQSRRPAVGHRVLQELRDHQHAQDAVPRRGVQLPEPPEPERPQRGHHQRELRSER